jgi:heat shock protein HslJ
MKSLFILTTILLVAVLSVVTASCASRDAGLNGTYWHLAQYGAQAATVPVLAGTAVTLNFNSDGSRITGNGGCNDYFADCLLDGNSIGISNLGATKISRNDPPGIMQQESAFFELLGKAERFELKGDRMTIYCTGDKVLAFERVKNVTSASGLAGTSWHLESYGLASQPKPLLATTAITLVFDSTAAHISGNASVNTYRGDCEIHDSGISTSRIYQTQLGSPDTPGVMQQESEYLTLLAAAESFAVSDNGLTIYCSGGDELRFSLG